MARSFASTDVNEEKEISFEQLTENAWVYVEEGDPTSGVVIGDDGVMVIDTRATPIAAQDLKRRVAAITDKPFKYVVLTHYHAVRVLGAAAYGAEHVICSEPTHDLIRERGQQDYDSEAGRFPRLFRGIESIPGLTWPTITFRERMTVMMGGLEVQIIHPGRGHTKGDTVVWLPEQRVLFSGDLVENGATPYTGDAYLRDWPQTLEKLRQLQPRYLVPGRGPAMTTPEDCEAAMAGTESFIRALYEGASQGVGQDQSLKQVYDSVVPRLEEKYGHWSIFDHCMPFDISRAYDEAAGIEHPRIWTAERDREMWKQLEDG
ncbi:MBL fold metallo-hydrolase [Minwuia thermotolerans]|uniref:MBL fold metallo-hydrolase n=1 Tax=Minwuia thermotolerans TaxID=2056226 RepID=A0A2M9G7F0_9PROT|nr:MBL fold metallo-hydrolase [Minwuia thermotolerans]PJK31631.1 MBL fold metallo-hydrolase [Minwuia thermotolerans]